MIAKHAPEDLKALQEPTKKFLKNFCTKFSSKPLHEVYDLSCIMDECLGLLSDEAAAPYREGIKKLKQAHEGSKESADYLKVKNKADRVARENAEADLKKMKARMEAMDDGTTLTTTTYTACLPATQATTSDSGNNEASLK